LVTVIVHSTMLPTSTSGRVVVPSAISVLSILEIRFSTLRLASAMS